MLNFSYSHWFASLLFGSRGMLGSRGSGINTYWVVIYIVSFLTWKIFIIFQVVVVDLISPHHSFTSRQTFGNPGGAPI